MELAIGICYIGCLDERTPALLDSVHHAWQERPVTKVTRCWSPAVDGTDVAVRNSHNHISTWVRLALERTIGKKGDGRYAGRPNVPDSSPQSGRNPTTSAKAVVSRVLFA
jgi:hypothetical protein